MDVRGMIARITIDFIEEGTDTVVSSVPAVIVVPDAVADQVRDGEQPYVEFALYPTMPVRWMGEEVNLDDVCCIDSEDGIVFKEHR